ncbi:hypothetical protein BX616_001974 [Lobosporangium transversale]|uniref:Hydrophobic surface binding protein A-domain-containing protein n=1 Tax=Lobosporangium transversale TaxID=64571 RepID=A0A1Y2H1X0_9FUNG|nr:hypothetical protein BCR41DRAFT_345486 [Lobosporangium transversale]KAF9902335.1 hypothetical protein BX616_001974 [Lobosporangium transversale]ORZ28535.1 hypothetical protein BCR41DRAFT_345486 [Lobosporangium transversale]|eukprot:XP_021886220.1 hypothetical protein BCR41DRAFT_345486 [Lobosporangium transversale]
MRIFSFVPAVLALSVFSAAQAAPALITPRDNLDAVIGIFVGAQTKIMADVAAKITADVCADVNIEANAKVVVLGGLLTTTIDVEKISLNVKAKLDADIKLYVDAAVKATVLVPIRAIVSRVVLNLCPLLENECIKRNAHNIVVAVNAEIDVCLDNLFVELKVKLPIHIHARAKIIIRELTLNAGIATAAIRARIFISAKIDAHIKAWINLWVNLCAKLQLAADIGLL